MKKILGLIMKDAYDFYIMQNGKPEQIKYSSSLKIKLSKEEEEKLRKNHQNR